MTPQASRTTAVEIIDASNVVVGTATTQPDGSFSCTVPLALGGHILTARSGNETSSDYHLTVVPESVTDTFDDMYEGQPISGEREFLTLQKLGGTVHIEDSGGHPPFLENSMIRCAVDSSSGTAHQVAGRLLVTLKKPARKVRVGCYRINMEGSSPTVRYRYDTAEEYSLSITSGTPGWVEHVAPGARYITALEFCYPTQENSLTYAIYVDNFTMYQ